jgi:hypothetical protein
MFAALAPHHVVDAADVPHELWAESLLQFGRMVSPWTAMLDDGRFQAAVDVVAALGATTVAGGHTPALRGPRLAEAFELVRRFPSLPEAELLGQVDLDAILAGAAAPATEAA